MTSSTLPMDSGKNLIDGIHSLAELNGTDPSPTTHSFNTGKPLMPTNCLMAEPNEEDMPQNFFQGSNSVRCLEKDDSITVHLPAYISSRYDNLVDINFESKTVSLHGSIILNVYYGQLPQQWVKQIEKSLIISIGKRMHLNLNDEQYAEDLTIIMKPTNNPKRKLLTYVIKGIFQTVMEADVFFCPFEDVQIIFSVVPHAYMCQFLGKLAHIKLDVMVKYDEGPKYIRKISVPGMMNLKDRTSHCEYILRKDKCKVQIQGKFGKDREEEIDITQKRQYRKKYKPTIDKTEKQQSLKQFRREKLGEKANRYRTITESYGITQDDAYFVNEFYSFHEGGKPLQSKQIYFTLCFIKNPVQTFLAVILPLAFISVVNFSVYLMDNVFNDRIATIATLLITYTTFMPTVRQRTPISPRLTLIDLVVISVMLLSLLSLIRSIVDRGKQIPTNHWKSDPLFLVPLSLWCLLLLLFIGLFVHIQIIIFRNPNETMLSKGAAEGDFELWSNDLLDKGYEVTKEVPRYSEFVKTNHIFQRIWIERLMTDAEFRARQNYKPSSESLSKEERFKEQLDFYKEFWSKRREYCLYIRTFMPFVDYYNIRLENFQSALYTILNREDHVDMSCIKEQKRMREEEITLKQTLNEYRSARNFLLESYRNLKNVNEGELEFRIVGESQKQIRTLAQIQ